jgi:parallel beta-helix repeat protein
MKNADTGIRCFNPGAHTIIGCTVSVNGGGGINAYYDTMVKNCMILKNTGYGVSFVSGLFIKDCQIYDNDTGIEGANVTWAHARVQGNNITSHDYGLDLHQSEGNSIYANTFRDNDTNMWLDVNNSAPTSSVAATAGPWHNLVF